MREAYVLGEGELASGDEFERAKFVLDHRFKVVKSRLGPVGHTASPSEVRAAQRGLLPPGMCNHPDTRNLQTSANVIA